MGDNFKDTNLPDIIELQDISTSFDGGKTFIIKNFNLLIKDIPDAGEFIVILGKSGCGKTTILKYIAGLTNPTSGRVLIRGRDRSHEVPISMVFQEPSALEHYTVLKNVMLPLLYRHVPEREAAERAM
ncbi:ATP-binding cassette domain-containing protein, partial [candidate division KSB1 bacterium]|nr:ATP-binding cassette domain-containing protein [candidate division KSB1 bacterium]